MNERIKQLKHQASLWCDINVPEQFSEYGYGEVWEDKFAELIVQECIDIISPYTVRMSRPGEEYLHPIQEIKQHFGVKE